MEKNYEGKTMFNFEGYEKLILAIGEKLKLKPDDENALTEMDIVSRAVKACVEYVSNVDNGENAIRTAYFRHEGEDLRSVIEGIDKSRRIAHENAIACVSMLNRVATLFNHMDVIFIGDINDRLQVADFCLEVTVKLFNERKK